MIWNCKYFNLFLFYNQNCGSCFIFGKIRNNARFCVFVNFTNSCHCHIFGANLGFRKKFGFCNNPEFGNNQQSNLKHMFIIIMIGVNDQMICLESFEIWKYVLHQYKRMIKYFHLFKFLEIFSSWKIIIKRPIKDPLETDMLDQRPIEDLSKTYQGPIRNQHARS